MENGDGQQIQLPPGYEDAKITKSPSTPSAPPATQSSAQNTSGIVLPPGYEDAQVTKSPTPPANQTSSTPPAPTKTRGQRIWDAILHPEMSGASSIKLGSQGGDAPQSLPANSDPGFTQGAEKGLTATLGGISGHLGGPGAEPQEKNPSTPSEWTGYAMESAAEFYAGDEAFKALPLADKLKKLQSVAETLAEHPMLAKLAAVGARSLRYGTVAGLDTFARGATPSEAVKTGGEVAGVTAALEGAVIPGAVKLAKYYFNPFRQIAKTAQAAGETKAPGLIKQIWQGEKVAQAPAESALRGAAEAPLGTPSPASLRTSLEQPIEAIENKASANYKLMDAATDNELQPNIDRLKNVNLKLRGIAGTDDAMEARLTVEKTRLEWQQERLFDKASSKGVPKATVDLAREQFKQAQALRDLETKVFKNPNIVQGNAAKGMPETINVDGAVKALQKLQDNETFGAPRLEQALGSEADADALLKSVYRAKRLGMTAITKQQIAKWVGASVGVASAAKIINLIFGGSPSQTEPPLP